MFEKLPKNLIERLKNIFSTEELKIINEWFSIKKRNTTFRINKLKWTDLEVFKCLEDNNILYEKIDILKNWYKILNKTEKDLWNLDIFKNWKIYLQWISSQIPAEILELSKWDRVLDLTASPWSKTSQIAEILENTWEIIANDNNAIRIDKLNFTLNRQWVTNTKVVKYDARNLWNEFEEESFDKILADLPCSAEWRININDEKTFWFWSEKIIKENYDLQKNILKNSVKLLKKWWILVYSTCTISPEENEWIVHFLLSNFKELEIQDININSNYIKNWIKSFNWNIYNKNIIKSKRFLPNIESEWFFVAKFKKI